MTVDLKSALRSLDAFSRLGDEGLEKIIPYVTLRDVRAGETVFAQNEPSPFCFGVLSGEVTIKRVTRNTNLPSKILGVIGPGGIFGEASIFEDVPRAAMASATKDGKLILLRGPQLREWIRSRPGDAQPLLLALLSTTMGRLYRTSHELAVIFGIGRLLSEAKTFYDRLGMVFEFLKGSMEGLDDIIFYQRSAYWEEFAPLMSLPRLSEIPAIPIQHPLIRQARTVGTPAALEPSTRGELLSELKLSWEDKASVAILPLYDWDKADDPLQGLLLLASQNDPHAFGSDKHLLLAAIGLPLAEALSRHVRTEVAEAQSRLQQSKNTY